MDTAFIFPGQGSQRVGMGKALADASPIAREVFEEIDEALGQHLSRLMAEGPEQELTLTENTQPALFAVSMAVVRVLEGEAGIALADKARFFAGHSLGEYAALAAAGSLALADGARILRQRGAAMQRAVAPGEGAMAALLGVDREAADAIAADAAAAIGDGAVCAAANDNADGQVVISGHAAAIDKALEIAAERGARRSKRLSVSAPFHCALMEPAAEEMRAVLADVDLAVPTLPIMANVTAQPEQDPARLRALLIEQVTAPVRWRESVLAMRDSGVERLIELGSGRVLSGLTRRIDRAIAALAAETPEEIDSLIKSL